ncbi:MAG: hypothetical protein IKW74_01190, partial [Thermoguttaceae bacterium]|nr:hypothetical protein [Thermoguttaceae bacterium]
MVFSFLLGAGIMFYGSCLFAQVNDGDLEFSSFVQTLIRDSEGKPEKLAFHGQMSDTGGLTGGHLQAVPVSRSEVMTSTDVKKILSAQENRAGESGGMFSVPESSLVSGGADFLFQSQNVPDNQGNLSPGRMEDSVDLNNGVGQLVLESLDENAAVFLSVDDITSFSDSGDSLEQESNRKDASWEQETESTIILSGPPENAEDTEFSEIIAVCQENLEESLTLFREYPPMTSWVQETERLVLEILENMENNSGKSRQALTALKNHLTLLDGFKSRLIQEDKQKKPSYVTASIGFGLNTGEKKDGSLFNGVVVRDVKNGDNEPEISSWSRDGQNGSAGSLLETGVAQSSCIKRASSFSIRSVNAEVPVMTISDSSESGENDSAESGLPALIARYNLASRLELVDVLRIALDRRIYLWSLAVDYYEAKRNGILVPHHEFTTGELLLLQRQTEEVRNFFGISATGQGWRDVFEVDLLYADIERILKRMKQGDVAFRPVSVNTEEDNGEVFSGSDLKHEWECLNGRINTICYKVSVTPMTVDQKKVFVREPMIGWVQTLQCFTSDRLVGNDLLREFEIYERTGGGMTGVRLYQDGMQMKHSPSPVCRKFGEAIEIIYDNPNLKVYISEMLINRLLPIRDPEFDVVQETVLNNPVAGRRRTDTQVFIKL